MNIFKKIIKCVLKCTNNYVISSTHLYGVKSIITSIHNFVTNKLYIKHIAFYYQINKLI